jgi:hypothetical protein
MPGVATLSATGDGMIMREKMDNRVHIEAVSQLPGHPGTVFLSSSEDGTLVIGVSRDKPRPAYRLVRASVFGSSLRVTGRHSGPGELVSAPYLSSRALHVAVDHRTGEGAQLNEIEPAELEQPGRSGLGWVFDWRPGPPPRRE